MLGGSDEYKGGWGDSSRSRKTQTPGHQPMQTIYARLRSVGSKCAKNVTPTPSSSSSHFT